MRLQSIFLVTRLEPGEEAWSAVKDMVSQNHRAQHSRDQREEKAGGPCSSLMPCIEDFARRDNQPSEQAAKPLIDDCAIAS